MADEPNPNTAENDNEEVSWEDAFREAAEGQPQETVHEPAMAGQMAEPAVVEPRLPADRGGETGAVDIDFLLDIQLTVAVEIGRKKIPINDLLQMQQGSVIDLDKMVGEPFDVYVNDKLMAYGEVVVVNEKFGIRLTDVIDPKERLEKLR